MKQRIEKQWDSLLAYGNQQFGFDISYFIKGGFWQIISTLLNGLTAFLTVLVLTRALTPDYYGQYRFFIAILNILMIFSLPPMQSAIIRAVARGKEGAFIDGTRYRLLFSLLGSFAWLLAGFYLLFVSGSILWPYAFMASVIFPAIFSFENYLSFLAGKEKYALQLKYRTLFLLLFYVPFITIALASKKLSIIIPAYLILFSTSHWLMYRSVRKKFLPKLKKAKKNPSLFKYATQLTLISIIPTVNAHIDKILLIYFLNPTAVAIYAVAQSIANLSVFATKPFARLLLPKFSKHRDLKKTFTFLQKKMWLILTISATPPLLGVLLSPYLVRFLFPAAYSESIFFAQVIFIATAFQFANMLFLNFFTSYKMTKNIFYTTFFPGIIVLGLMVILLPLVGIIGVIVARLIGDYTLFFQSLYLGKREAYKE